MITLDTFNPVMLAMAVISIVLNIIQFRTKRTIFEPTYNGLIGFLNDIQAYLSLFCNLLKNGI